MDEQQFTLANPVVRNISKYYHSSSKKQSLVFLWAVIPDVLLLIISVALKKNLISDLLQNYPNSSHCHF